MQKQCTDRDAHIILFGSVSLHLGRHALCMNDNY